MVKKTTTKKVAEKSVMELIDELVMFAYDENDMNEKGDIIRRGNKGVATELQKRLGLQTPKQAAILAAFVDMFDCKHVTVSQLARHFNVRKTKMLTELGEMDYFLELGYVTKGQGMGGELCYSLNDEVVENLRQGRLPEPLKRTELTIVEFADQIMEHVGLFGENNHETSHINDILDLISLNQQLPIAHKLESMELDWLSELFFAVLLTYRVRDGYQSIGAYEMRDYFKGNDVRHILKRLKDGCDPLVHENLVEPHCVNGQAEPGEWSLTRHCCEVLLDGLNIKVSDDEGRNRDLTSYKEIEARELYYSAEVERKVEKLEELLQPERMKSVLDRLGAMRMRRCFTCMFYGHPGTGKTETVRQLARRTGRDMMVVDIPSIRSKWVGDTEKNIKQVFDRYRTLAKGNDRAPILLFNEADALLNRRNKQSDSSVDKMENALQDIILSEMEELEGIMIATTNMCGALDEAFERRFLYKIEFERPTALTRKAIWKTMLPTLSDESALRLADKFDFSGGEIENVSRKYVIDTIINGESEDDEELIFELCRAERYSASEAKTVGFDI